MLKTPRATYKLTLPLLGKHQLDNAATAVLALEAIDVDEASIKKGLASTRWPGRIEVVRRKPLIIADSAHERDSARRLAQTLRDDFGRASIVLVVGCAKDKDVGAIADELAPLATQVIATRSRNPRSMDPREIARVFAERGLSVAIEEPVGSAIEAAIALGEQAVVACGSLFVAAEAREHILGVAYDPPLEVAV
jgi:dihydrofolate synthase/folylpolyglutamate synthase